jgi:hypothetical protein
MTKNPYNAISVSKTRQCLQANQHNALTSFYYLLMKKMLNAGEPLDLTEKPATR